MVYALGDNEKFASLQKLGKYSKKLFLTALFNHVKIESYQGCYYELHGMVQRFYNVKIAMYVNWKFLLFSTEYKLLCEKLVKIEKGELFFSIYNC